MAERDLYYNYLPKPEFKRAERKWFIGLDDPSPSPTSLNTHAWVFLHVNTRRSIARQDETRHGSWLIVRPFTQLDSTWELIRSQAARGTLRHCVIYAKCSTMYYNPRRFGPGPLTSGVIAVSTTEEHIEEAGIAMINIVKHDIKYKISEKMRSPVQNWTGDNRRTCRTLYWNDGSPSEEMRTDCSGPSCVIIPDKWGLNVVDSPVVDLLDRPYGFWLVGIKHDSSRKMTALWQYFRREIISGDLGQVRMICPQRDAECSDDRILFKLYTVFENRCAVGQMIACYTSLLKETTIQITYKETEANGQLYAHSIEWDEEEEHFVYTLNLCNYS